MLIIGIAGGTGSGKTTVARSVIDRLGSDKVTFISQDNYYKDHKELSFDEREAINYDHPFALTTSARRTSRHFENRTARICTGV